MLKYHNRKKKRALCSLFFIITKESIPRYFMTSHDKKEFIHFLPN
nr:MAG TPA: hypothetical protein [Caudoviricetes sp.]